MFVDQWSPLEAPPLKCRLVCCTGSTELTLAPSDRTVVGSSAEADTQLPKVGGVMSQ